MAIPPFAPWKTDHKQRTPRQNTQQTSKRNINNSTLVCHQRSKSGNLLQINCLIVSDSSFARLSVVRMLHTISYEKEGKLKFLFTNKHCGQPCNHVNSQQKRAATCNIFPFPVFVFKRELNLEGTICYLHFPQNSFRNACFCRCFLKKDFEATKEVRLIHWNTMFIQSMRAVKFSTKQW